MKTTIHKLLVLCFITLLSVNHSNILGSSKVVNSEFTLPNQLKVHVNWTDTIQQGEAISMNGILKEDDNSTVSYTKYMGIVEISIESFVFGSYAFNNRLGKFEARDYFTPKNDAIEEEISIINNRKLIASLVLPTDTAPIIDVLFVYPVETKILLGGVNQVIAKALHCVNNTNSSYSNSGIKSRVRLVQVAEINYQTGSTLSSELGNLKSTTDGKMDEIHAMRNEAGADIVCLLTDKDTQNTKGIAYILSTVNGSPTNGFTVVHYAQAEGVFLHELGHNLGCNHNKETGGSSLYSYSFGNSFTHNGVLRGTLMSYIGQRCSRFAGPDSKWEGTITGNSTTADVVRTINQSGYIVAKYQNSKKIIDLNIRIDSIDKSTIKCTVSNKATIPASKSQLSINLPEKCFITGLSTVNQVHYNQSLNLIEIDSLYANESKSFTINLNTDSLKIASYNISSTIKNISANHNDYNLADNSYETKISLGTVSTGISNIPNISQNELNILSLTFSENTKIETKKPITISIHNINGYLCFNRKIHGSYIIGTDLSKGVYFLTVSFDNTIVKYKLLKY